jgi:glycerol kinase
VKESKHRLLTTVAWWRGNKLEYAMEGSVFSAGSVVQWLRDGLGIIRTAEEVEALALSVSDNGGVYVVPAFTGLGAPHWDPLARGAIVGITRGTKPGHIARAALESIAYQVADLLDAMQDDSGIPLDVLRVDGGAARNDALLQFQADLLGIPVVRSAGAESTSLGAAFLAGLAVGFWQDLEELQACWKAEKEFRPARRREEIVKLHSQWRRAVERSKEWAETEI